MAALDSETGNAAAAPGENEEWRKMCAGDLYNANDPFLIQARAQSRALAHAYNASPDAGDAALLEKLGAWLGSVGAGVVVTPPFRCDYGSNIELGAGVYMNFDAVILDCARVRVGARTFFGPGVHLYPATHPLDGATRATLESAHEIHIGADCWIGGRSVVLCSGRKGEVRTIGDGCVIGAGSVVTKDVPPYSLAVGNPAKVIRQLK